eukprot:m.65791 g.65791  ORF g.65791 m.65791 type:complete len:266 (-) comp7588_c0_seq3:179-976(-)
MPAGPDISSGYEKLPVPWSNELDAAVLEPPPYAGGLVLSPALADRAHVYSSCTCEVCDSACTCPQQFRGVGVGDEPSAAPLAVPLFECGPACACSGECPQSKVRDFVQFPLEVVKTPLCGWSAVARDAIPPAQFICIYAGELISTAEAQQRLGRYVDADNDYLLIIREHLATRILRTNVDATPIGNVGRFFNHSCAPNCELRLVRRCSFFPTPSLFSLRAIAPGEHLSFDYGAGLEPEAQQSPSGRLRPCHCGAAECRGFLVFRQ